MPDSFVVDPRTHLPVFLSFGPRFLHLVVSFIRSRPTILYRSYTTDYFYTLIGTDYDHTLGYE